MNDFENIRFPSGEEKDRSIRMILEEGIPRPKRMAADLWETAGRIGFKNLFFGVGDCMFLALLLGGLLWAGCFAVMAGGRGQLSVLLFLASPFLYALLHLLSIWKEIMVGTYETLMVCRCSLHQLMVLRMLVFGGLAVIVLVGTSTGVGWLLKGSPSVLNLLGISFSALFLFAAASAAAEWKWRAPGAYLVVPAGWILLSLVLLILGERAEAFLRSIPDAVFWIAAACGAVFYGRTLKHYYFDPKEGAIAHVVR
ncbi:hypothetical protein KTH81_21545 [Lachnospiraceae bacterium ASD3451]|uniref:hypothetical protein n=1 Tax=Diplocloster agilis TaxID=2850323 RepID=UPI001D2BE13D|nr:hypothetical protein [Diplocloster agilis]MBU9746405.1 hypothetical protein [Diplocloster agilis]